MKNNPNKLPAGDFPAGLSQPALRALNNAGITQLEQLARFSEKEIKELHGIGPNAVSLLSKALSDRGLAFAAANPPGE
jgi:predicted flap endonuclease-1-like 5' DNA nuclease